MDVMPAGIVQRLSQQHGVSVDTVRNVLRFVDPCKCDPDAMKLLLRISDEPVQKQKMNIQPAVGIPKVLKSRAYRKRMAELLPEEVAVKAPDPKPTPIPIISDGVMSFLEIGRELGVSPVRARQIFTTAIKKIRSRPKAAMRFAEMVEMSREIRDKQIQL